MVYEEDIIRILPDYGISRIAHDLMTQEVFGIAETIGIWLSLDTVKMWVMDGSCQETESFSYSCDEFPRLMRGALTAWTEREEEAFKAGNDLCEAAADTLRGLADQNGRGIKMKLISARDHTPIPLQTIGDWFIHNHADPEEYLVGSPYNVKNLCKVLTAARQEILRGEYRFTSWVDGQAFDIVLRPSDGIMDEGAFAADALIRTLEAALAKRRDLFESETRKKIEKERDACRQLDDFLRRRRERYQPTEPSAP